MQIRLQQNDKCHWDSNRIITRLVMNRIKPLIFLFQYQRQYETYFNPRILETFLRWKRRIAKLFDSLMNEKHIQIALKVLYAKIGPEYQSVLDKCPMKCCGNKNFAIFMGKFKKPFKWNENFVMFSSFFRHHWIFSLSKIVATFDPTIFFWKMLSLRNIKSKFEWDFCHFFSSIVWYYNLFDRNWNWLLR